MRRLLARLQGRGVMVTAPGVLVELPLWVGRPRLRVVRDHPGRWFWTLTAAGELLDSGHADSWDEAIAVGLAALEAASVSGRSGA